MRWPVLRPQTVRLPHRSLADSDSHLALENQHTARKEISHLQIVRSLQHDEGAETAKTAHSRISEWHSFGQSGSQAKLGSEALSSGPNRLLVPNQSEVAFFYRESTPRRRLEVSE